MDPTRARAGTRVTVGSIEGGIEPSEDFPRDLADHRACTVICASHTVPVNG